MFQGHMRWAASLFVLSGVSALYACSGTKEPVQADGNGAAAARGPTVIAGATRGRPSWATVDNYAGRAPSDEVISIQVHLRMQDEAGARAELAAVSDPDSPRHGQFLTRAQFDAKYAPTPDDVAAVEKHLEAAGMKVTYVPSNRAYVAAQGTASQVEAAFGTTLGRYEVQGETRRAAMTETRLPDDVEARVLGVLGISSPLRLSHRHVTVGGVTQLKRKAQSQQPSCSTYFGQYYDNNDPPYGGGFPYPMPVAGCGYTPPELRDGYGFTFFVNNGADGHGVGIAIVDAYLSPTLSKDATTYAKNNDPNYPLDPKRFTTRWAPGTPTPPDPGWWGEETLDVEAAHAIAPGATINVVAAQSAYDQDLIAAINLVLTDNLGSVISNSYGLAEVYGDATQFAPWYAAATQAGLLGVGLYFSSGDYGDEVADVGQASADFPASMDIVTAVGGTALGLGLGNQRLFELGWETSVSFLQTDDAGYSWQPPAPGAFYYGAGGGPSQFYAQPQYQVGTVSLALAGGNNPMRVVPDVSMVADPETGYLIGQSDSHGNYGEYPIGGTSLACPLFAASMAIAQQHTGKPIGFAGPMIYRASKHGAFRDIQPSPQPSGVIYPSTQYYSAAIATFDYQGLTIHTAPEYDDVTGLGTPLAAKFIQWVTY